MSMGDNNKGAVAGSFNFAAQLPNGQSLTFSGYIIAGETEAEINDKLDCACRAVARQRMIAEIPELEVKLENTVQARDQIETILEDLQAKSKPTPQDRNLLNTHRVNLKKLDADIIRGKEAIAKAKANMAVA